MARGRGAGPRAGPRARARERGRRARAGLGRGRFAGGRDAGLPEGGGREGRLRPRAPAHAAGPRRLRLSGRRTSSGWRPARPTRSACGCSPAPRGTSALASRRRGSSTGPRSTASRRRRSRAARSAVSSFSASTTCPRWRPTSWSPCASSHPFAVVPEAGPLALAPRHDARRRAFLERLAVPVATGRAARADLVAPAPPAAPLRAPHPHRRRHAPRRDRPRPRRRRRGDGGGGDRAARAAGDSARACGRARRPSSSATRPATPRRSPRPSSGRASRRTSWRASRGSTRRRRASACCSASWAGTSSAAR